MKFNNRGQASIFTIIIIVILFLILLGVFFAPFISTSMGVAISISGLTGSEAFFFANMLLWIILAFIIWALWNTR